MTDEDLRLEAERIVSALNSGDVLCHGTMTPHEARVALVMGALRKAAGEWRPIETAPISESVLISGGRYADPRGTFGIEGALDFVVIANRADKDNVWEGGDGDANDGPVRYFPTHWRDLPPPVGASHE